MQVQAVSPAVEEVLPAVALGHEVNNIVAKSSIYNAAFCF
jgi:hypothetical protein